MDTDDRRKEIEKLLVEAKEPITGKDLADKFNVTRQVIVQDIALLRAAGADVLATPQGYFIPGHEKQNLEVVVATRHDQEGIRDELNAMVDLGAKVVDVIVEHPLYGELRGLLMLSSRLDVDRFVDRLLQSEARPLSALTAGVHLHTLELADPEALPLIKEKLKQLGMLVE